MDGLSENLKQPVVHYFGCFTSHDQTKWDDYLPLSEYAYNFSVHHSTKHMPFELDFGYQTPLPPDWIADLQRLQANQSARTLQGRKFLEQLQRISGVTRDELRDAQDE